MCQDLVVNTMFVDIVEVFLVKLLEICCFLILWLKMVKSLQIYIILYDNFV